MAHCTEFAVFEVNPENRQRVLSLSETLFAEINAEQENILAHEILENIDNAQEVCWHLTWANKAAVEQSRAKWPSYASSAELESLVGKKLFYGHFVALLANK